MHDSNLENHQTRLPQDLARSPRVCGMPPTRVLLVEDDYETARLVNRRLAWSALANFQLEWVLDLEAGLESLEREGYDAVLLDLSLPGSEGIATIAAVSAVSRHIPFLILTGNDNDQLAVTAARGGAQDYLVKQEQDARSLGRAVLAAIVRHRRMDAPAPLRPVGN